MATTATSRTLKHLRERGYEAQVVERWCSFSRRRIDLFNIVDIVAVKPGEIVGVQSTAHNLSNRLQKSIAEPKLRAWLESGARFLIVDWRKRKKGKSVRWEPVEREVTLDDLTELEVEDHGTE